MKNLVSKIGEGAKAVGGALSRGAKYVGVGATCVAAVAYAPERAEGSPIRIMSFSDLADSSVPVKSVGMPVGTNLMYRDPITGVDSVVEAGSRWYQGYINYLPSVGVEVVGYSENSKRDGTDPDQVGRLYGKYLETIGEGKRPEDVWTVNDKDGILGIADYYPDTHALVFDVGDDFYFANDLLFGPGKVRGDVSQLPMLVTSGSIYLPEMVVDVPEPGTLALLAVGGAGISLRRRRGLDRKSQRIKGGQR